jgi:uncharacterized protein DUF5655/uncharacterized protein DUF4287
MYARTRILEKGSSGMNSSVDERTLKRAQVEALLGATGRSLDDWITILEQRGPLTEEPRARWLQEEHRLSGDIAVAIASAASEQGGDELPEPKALIAAQYAGEMKGARSVYDRLAQAVKACGREARVDARRTYVSLIRHRQFGIITPGPGKAVTLGLTLPGAVQSDRLDPHGRSQSDRVTHTVVLRSRTEVDAEITAWLRAAFDAAG